MLQQDETEGVKGVMGLLLGCVLPALERHYSVFVGNEVGRGALPLVPLPALQALARLRGD